ncbi:hypothetical protein OR221_1556 [Microbacterium laevaniformans OR221]|uniref:hypothetical protein n=1 Tax=Microbacterium sp. 69-7 TaxID=1895784 RepID=UPI0002588697|nr:hypothetical protein [Microbacterium sp. 69-7]EIC08463.1 hypothetical protein OR221_1556 [Microbacterium laevaniformans OR221]
MSIRTIFTRIRDAVLGPPETHDQRNARKPSREQEMLHAQHLAVSQARYVNFIP